MLSFRTLLDCANAGSSGCRSRVLLAVANSQSCCTCSNSHTKLVFRYTGSSRVYSTVMDFQKVKLITFDVTGTLLAFRKPPVEIYRDFGEKYGIQCKSERMKASFKLQWQEMNKEQPHFGTDWEAWWTEFVIRTFKEADAHGLTDANMKKVATDLIAHFKTTQCWKLKDGAEELINALQMSVQQKEMSNHRGLVAIGIISNFDPRLYGLLAEFKMDKLFTPVILSHEHQTSKPSAKIFNLALAAFKRALPQETIEPSEALHVGDSYKLDYVGAKNAGWKSCLITSNFNSLDIPDKTIFSPMENEIHKDLHSFKEFLTLKGKSRLFHFHQRL